MNEGDRPQVDIEKNDDQFTAFANSRVSLKPTLGSDVEVVIVVR